MGEAAREKLLKASATDNFRTGAECWLLVQRSPIVNDHDDEVRAAFARMDEGGQRIILFQEQSRRAACKTVAVTVVIYAF